MEPSLINLLSLLVQSMHYGWTLMTVLNQCDMISLQIINCLCISIAKWAKSSSRRLKAQHAERGTPQTFVSRLSTNSSYYYCCGETEKLLIPISISHQGSAQLQSHLKAIDCGFKRQMKWASFTSRWNDLYWSEVRVETVKSTSPGVGVSLWKKRHLCKIIRDAWVQRRVHVICSFISSSTLTPGSITPDAGTCISDVNPTQDQRL